MRLAEGTIIDDRYVIKKYISSGGFGNTYEAFDNRLEAHVAIKELFVSSICSRGNDNQSVNVSNPQNISSFDSHKRRFMREARRLRKLSHPNIVSVTDVFEANGTAYFVMDFIDGKSYASYPIPLTENKIKKHLDQLLSALEHVHEKGILHLDIKPGNIMIDRYDNAILIDFGASKLIDNDDDKSLNTSTVTAYTPGYAPLEQMSASNSKNLGPHSDIYALAATFYTLLSGKKPPLPDEILLSPLAPLSNVSPQLRDAIDLSMKVLYTQRLASVAQFRKVLACETINIVANHKTIKETKVTPEIQKRPASHQVFEEKTKTQTAHTPSPKAPLKPVQQPMQPGINGHNKPWDKVPQKGVVSNNNKRTTGNPANKKNSERKKTIIASICVACVFAIVCIVGIKLSSKNNTHNSDNPTPNNTTTLTDTVTADSITNEQPVTEDNNTSSSESSAPTQQTNAIAQPTQKYNPTHKVTRQTTTPSPSYNNTTKKPTKNTTNTAPLQKQDNSKANTQEPQKSNSNNSKTKVSLPNVNKIDNSNKKVTIPSKL